MTKQILSLAFGYLIVPVSVFAGGPITSGGGGITSAVVKCSVDHGTSTAVFEINKPALSGIYRTFSETEESYVSFGCKVSKNPGELYVCLATKSCLGDDEGLKCSKSNLVAVVDKHGTDVVVTIAPKNSDSDIVDQMVCKLSKLAKKSSK